MVNLCIVNVDHPRCDVPRKTIKACQGKGPGTLLLREWPAVPFPPQDLVVHVYLSIAAITQDPAGPDPCK